MVTGAPNALTASSLADIRSRSSLSTRNAHGRYSDALPPECRSSAASHFGSSTDSTQWAMAKVGVPPASPGYARFMLPPSMGDTRESSSTAG